MEMPSSTSGLPLQRRLHRKVGKELLCAGGPGALQRKGPASIPFKRKCLAASGCEVFVEGRNIRSTNDVQRSLHRVCRDWCPAGMGLEQDEAERVGAAGEDEDVARLIGVN